MTFPVPDPKPCAECGDPDAAYKHLQKKCLCGPCMGRLAGEALQRLATKSEYECVPVPPPPEGFQSEYECVPYEEPEPRRTKTFVVIQYERKPCRAIMYESYEESEHDDEAFRKWFQYQKPGATIRKLSRNQPKAL